MAAFLARIVGLFYRPSFAARTNKYKLPLPRVCHQVLDETVIGDRQVFVVGDIHGCYDEMVDLLEKARAIDDDILILFAGDMINKGPKSVEVIRTIRQMPNVFAVRGNHEECSLREIRNFKETQKYDLPERYEWIRGLDEDDIEYINQLPYTISIPCLKILVVHAGIVPGRPLELQELNNLTNMRNVINVSEPFFNSYLAGSNKCTPGVAWAKTWEGPYHVYFGHDAKRSLQTEAFATGLDTGCVYGHALTGVFANGCKTMLSVKAYSSEYQAD